ncbi:hypothetical protein K438DRAFT_90632 [Mycena galopus ATCC 62051]|nr:hypothetical protein K438DRAFT_90632 [Mycena galopus ATCC 62051]
MLSSLAVDRARIAILDSKILAPDAENSIITLETERKSVQARLDAYAYPVLTLPHEIVSKIFVETLPLYPLCSPLCGPLSPTSLGQICGKWREIAFSTPMLWRAPSFIVPGEWTLRQLHLALDRGVELFETWLSRSRFCPLSIQLRDARYLGLTDLSRFVQIILLPKHCLRIEHLDLSVRGPSNIAPDGAEFPLSSLRALKLGSPFIDSMPLVRFLDAPQLETVHLIRPSYPSKLLLPWSQLTSLVLESISPENTITLLNKTVNLVYCMLRNSRIGVLPTQAVNPLTRLESLDISDQSTDFLYCLTLPALRNVKIGVINGIQYRCLDRLLSCVDRSGCSLQTLHIIVKGTPVGFSVADKCREMFPSISTIIITELGS